MAAGLAEPALLALGRYRKIAKSPEIAAPKQFGIIKVLEHHVRDVFAPKKLVVDHERRDAEDAPMNCLVGTVAQSLLDRRVTDTSLDIAHPEAGGEGAQALWVLAVVSHSPNVAKYRAHRRRIGIEGDREPQHTERVEGMAGRRLERNTPPCREPVTVAICLASLGRYLGRPFTLPMAKQTREQDRLHAHIQPWRQFRPEALRRMEAGRPDTERIHSLCDDPTAFLRFLDAEGVDRAVLVNYVSPDIIGFTDEVNAFIGAYCRGHEDRLVAMGGIHPRLTADPAGALTGIVERHAIRALKLHPPHQLFRANAYRDGGNLPALAQLYERAQDLRVPVMVHTGTSIFPGARNKYGDPMDLDDVAVDFPDLTIVMAHGGRPLWMDTCLFLVRRHPNVFMDISGIPPRRLLHYFPRLAEVAHKTLFGTDWPGPGVPGVRCNIDAFRALGLPAAAQRAILGETAQRVFPKP